MMIVDDWNGLYSKSWKKHIVPKAFEHPAKVSFGLAEYIYQHVIELGWLAPGAHVIDPFGGIGGFAFHAIQAGLHWSGVELEPRFVDLAQQNIDLWRDRYAPHFPGWGTARIMQGDSRQLAQLVSGAGGVVSSPPYADGAQHTGGNDTHPEHVQGGKIHLPGIAGAISSPPYAETPISQTHMTSNKRGDPDNPNYRPSWKTKLDDGYADTERPYGQTPGQLGAMKAGDWQAVVSSPPFEESLDRGNVSADERRKLAREKGISNAEHNSPIDMERIGERNQTYGSTPGNIGNTTGADFWSAAREIVSQVYQVLAPGAHACWVVKAFVKNKKRVDFPGQWQALCEAVGFETLHYHRAWVIEDRGAQYDLFGGLEERKVERKSFFRRLAEKKGSPRIDYEVVLCMVKRGPIPQPLP